MDKNISRIIGIDVGGTKILLQTFDSKLDLLEEVKVFTETKKGQTGFINQLYSLIDKVFHKDIDGIGIAFPGIVDIYKGTLVKAPHLPTKRDLNIRKLIEKRYKVPTAIDNDVNAFLIAEKERPQLKKYKNIIAVMVGTGLGGAIISGGKMTYGKNGYAGEFGHIVINSEGRLKTLEQNTSGSFVSEIAKKIGTKEKMTAKDLDKNTAETAKVKKHMLESLGIGLANLNLIFNPEVIVLGGSIYSLFLSGKKKELSKIISEHSLDKKTPILLDASKTTSVARGVAIRILEVL
jgi:glucokinase